MRRPVLLWSAFRDRKVACNFRELPRGVDNAECSRRIASDFCRTLPIGLFAHCLSEFARHNAEAGLGSTVDFFQVIRCKCERLLLVRQPL
jgi:hypothetical protein